MEIGKYYQHKLMPTSKMRVLDISNDLTTLSVAWFSHSTINPQRLLGLDDVKVDRIVWDDWVEVLDEVKVFNTKFCNIDY